MKKYLVLFIMAMIAMSCSKKIEVKGKVTGGSPLERIEFIEASGVATLPLINMGVDKDGNFQGEFEAPKNGMYVISYAGKQNLIYLKKGQSLEISGVSHTFPSEFKVNGDAKSNNDFLLETQKFMNQYSQNLNIQESMNKDANGFLKDIQKILNDLDKNIEDASKKTNADSDVVTWKKNDIRSSILSLIPQYEMLQKRVNANPSFTLSKNIKEFEEKMQSDKDNLVKEHPLYRNYLLSTISEEYQKFANTYTQGKEDVLTSQVFSEFIKKKDFSQIIKDYLLAYVIAQSDLNPNQSSENIDKLVKIIDTEIKDASVKEDIKKIQTVLTGLKKGEIAPDATLVKQDGKEFKISDSKGKPTVFMFYASWTPYIAEAGIPVLKEVVNFYKEKINFVFVNFDDTKDQFEKTSKSLLKGIKGTNVYAEGGLKSKFAQQYGVYGFKLSPSFIVLDKDGKVAGRNFFNMGEEEFVSLLDKLSGLKAPQVSQGDITLQNDLLVPNSK